MRSIVVFALLFALVVVTAEEMTMSQQLQELDTTWHSFVATPDDVYDLMKEMINTANAISLQWSSLLDATVEQIGWMADRIVYTEELIVDEAKEIGYMADRILETEQMMRDVAINCLHCNGPRVSPARSVLHVELSPLQPSPLPVWDEAAIDELIPQRRMGPTMGPIEGMIDLMNYTLAMMEEMSGEVTTEIYYMEEQIGVMANRIVGTECLIMNMSRQIGVMADRIVETELMMANLTDACCTLSPKSAPFPFLAPLHSRSDYPMPPPHCNVSSPADPLCPSPASLRAQASASRDLTRAFGRSSHALLRAVVGQLGAAQSSCPIWNLVCMAVEVMVAEAKAVMDEMFGFFQDTLHMMARGAAEIGRLADWIVHVEEQIIRMGLRIGDMSDMIVAVERMMFTVGDRMCGMPFVHKRAAREQLQLHYETLMAEGEVLKGLDKMLRAARERTVALREMMLNIRIAYEKAVKLHFVPLMERMASTVRSGGSYFNGPLAWMELMMEAMDAMKNMMDLMMDNMGNVMDGIDEMAERISYTVDLIGQMSEQINIMAGRIVETMGYMQQLENTCYPH